MKNFIIKVSSDDYNELLERKDCFWYNTRKFHERFRLMKIAIGADHGGFELKAKIMAAFKDCKDYGCFDPEACDYPDYADDVAMAVAKGDADFGVLICRTGIGMSMAANRFQGIRAALCRTVAEAAIARRHNGANILCIGADETEDKVAYDMLNAFMSAQVDEATRHVVRRGKLERAKRLSDFSLLAKEDAEVWAAIKDQVEQEDTEINLIASENTSSRACREATGSVLMNKYAEGYPGKRWYSGCLPVDAAEELARKRACELFGADHANVQPHSGANANEAVYFAWCEPGDKILAMSLPAGGHLTHGAPVTRSAKIYNFIDYGVTADGDINYDELEQKALAEQPKIILVGYSAFMKIPDFARVAKIAAKIPNCLLMADMAHVAGLIAGGVHPNPLDYGFNVMTTTTHKTLRGPRGALILCKAAFADSVNKGCPLALGGPLPHVMAAKAIAFKEARSQAYQDYAHKVQENARALAEECGKLGMRLQTNGTDNHLMLIDVTSFGLTGRQAENAMFECGVTLNRKMISEIAIQDPAGFKALVEIAKKAVA